MIKGTAMLPATAFFGAKVATGECCGYQIYLKRHYRAAYSYLKLAGDFAAAEKEILLKAFDKNALLKNHAGLLPTTTVKGKRSEIPISAFCRDGYVIRDSFAPPYKRRKR